MGEFFRAGPIFRGWRASRHAIEGEHNGLPKVRLTASPVEGKANHALRRLLSARLNVPLSAVKIVAGEKNRNKRVAIAGCNAGASRGAGCARSCAGDALIGSPGKFN